MRQKNLDLLYRLVMYFTAASLVYTIVVALYIVYACFSGNSFIGLL